MGSRVHRDPDKVVYVTKAPQYPTRFRHLERDAGHEDSVDESLQ